MSNLTRDTSTLSTLHYFHSGWWMEGQCIKRLYFEYYHLKSNALEKQNGKLEDLDGRKGMVGVQESRCR